MKKFNFEDKYLAEDNSLAHQYDTDEIWTNIEPKLKSQKKRRIIIWFFFGALILAGTLATIQVLVPKGTATNAATSIQNNHTVGDLASTSLLEESTSTNKLAGPLKTNSSTVNTPAPAKPVDKTMKSNITFSSIASTTQNMQNHTVIASVSQPVPLMSEQWKNKSEKTDQSSTPQSGTIQSSSTLSNKIVEKVAAPIIENNISIKEEKSSIVDLEKNKLKKINEKRVMKPSLTDKRDKTRSKSKKKLKKKLRRPVRSSKFRHAIEFVPGVYYGIESIAMKNMASESEYLDFRNQNVSQMPSYGFRSNYNMITPSGIFLTTGIEFIQLNEKVSREEVTIEETLKDVVVSIVENSEGQSIRTNTEEILVTTTSTYIQKLNNQYFMLNIPIGIGYSSNIGRTRFSISGGANYNLFTSFSGSIYNQDKELIDLVSGTLLYQNTIRKNTKWGVWTSFNIEKPITTSTLLSLSLGLQTPLKSITEDLNFYTQRLHITNLSLGIKYTLPIKEKKRRRRKAKD